MAYKDILLGDKAPEIINAVIEIPRGNSNKYEYDEELDVIKLDRVLHSQMFYPADYGFIPHTRSEDGDHLDVLVLITNPTFPGCALEVRPIGALDMEDESGIDWKIIAVSTNDPYFVDINDIEDMNDHLKKQIVHFFEQYKQLEDKWVKVNDWMNKAEALRLINEATIRFKEEG